MSKTNYIPKQTIAVLILLAAFFTFCTGESPRASIPAQAPTGQVKTTAPNTPNQTNNKLPDGMQCLKQSYPGFIDSVNPEYIVLKDGTKIPWDDGIIKKSFEETLNKASLKDMMAQCYKKGKDYSVPIEENYDPGRIRHEAFFYRMYGKDKKEAAANLTSIDWFGRKLRVTRVNDVNKRLDSVKQDLIKLPAKFYKYFEKTAGSFNWRKIAGTDRISVHSFGIAIDLNTAYSNYWRWEKPDGNGKYPYKNQMPIEIVEVFEKYGFIWGGKWYHYDTMHFEYRPELLVGLCRCGK